MKRLSLFFLIFMLIFLSLCLPTFANKAEKTPVIVLPGFSSSALYLQNADGTSEQVWGRGFEDILPRLFENIEGLEVDSSKDKGENIQILVDKIGRQLVRIMGVLACKSDGTSIQPIVPYSNEPAKSSLEYLENHDPDLIHEPPLTRSFAKHVGAENVFYFHVDFRQGAISCAKDLRAYVEAVKAHTGSEKVSIYALSHSGQITGAYLHLYGTRGDLEKVLLCDPALGGAMLARDILMGEPTFDLQALISLAEAAGLSDSQFSWLLQADSFDGLNQIFQQSLPYIYNIIQYWGSIWDFIPIEDYGHLKAELLDPLTSSRLIAQSDKMHYAVMSRYAQSFFDSRFAGTNIYIIAGTGLAGISGSQENSDGIISTSSATGALCAPFGKRFADGYKPSGAACKESHHNHLSPSMEVDASHAYLPEHTWFIDGKFHGQAYYDDFSRELLDKLLFSDEIADVHSSPDFPQFHASTRPSEGVFIGFDSSPEGYISDKDTYIVLTNLSGEQSMRLFYLVAKGMDIHFKTFGLGELQPNESVDIHFKGKLPDVSRLRTAVSVNYYQPDIFSLFKSRSFDFTVMNGAEVSYEQSSLFEDVDFPDNLHEIINEKTDELLRKLRLREFFSNVYDSVRDFIQ